MLIDGLIPQILKVLLGLPVPDTVARKQQINLLKCALVRFRIQRPYHWDCDGIARSEDIQRLLTNRAEHDRAKQREPTVADGPAHNSPSVAFGLDLQKRNVNGVTPWYRLT